MGARSCVFGALLALGVTPVALAVEPPKSGDPDPLRLRVCMLGLFGSVASPCELLDLRGPVRQVSLLEDGKPYEIYDLDRKGRVVARRTQVLARGWKETRLHHGVEGRLAETTVNGLSGSEYQYEAGQLAVAIRRRDKERCTFTRTGAAAGTRIEATCTGGAGPSRWVMTVDPEGRPVELDNAAAEILGLAGPMQCRYEETATGRVSSCDDGEQLTVMIHDRRGRLLSVRKTAKIGNRGELAEFAYTDDNAGNWVSQETRLTPLPVGRAAGQSYGRQRALTYFDPAVAEERPEEVRLSPKAESILRNAVDPAGILDKTLYDAFWREIPESVRGSAAKRAWLSEEVRRSAGPALGFQRELWNSVKQSVAQQREVRTEVYLRMRDDLIRRPDGPRHSARIVEEAEQLIQLAASGKSVRTPRGGMAVAGQRVETIVAGLDDGWARLDRLMAPEWTEAVRHYDDAHLTLASLTAYQRISRQEMIGTTLFGFILYRGPSEEGRTPTIGYIEAKGFNPSDQNLKALGYRLFRLSIFNTLDGPWQWRGRQAYVFSTLDRGQPGEPHQSILLVPDPVRSGLWVIGASSERSFMAAKALREHLENSIQLK